VANQIEHIGALTDGENEIEQIDSNGSPKDGAASQLPAQFSPGAQLCFVSWLTREGKPARTKRERNEHEKEDSGSEFG
jgi:hypothetical protein